MAVTMREMQVEQESLRSDLTRAVAEGEAWRRRSAKHLEGLAAAIREQFGAWRLTEAETEIAWLMLKRLALKEIAALRHTSQTTIRQQASDIYRKSGLSGRAELSAYFLDGLAPVERLKVPR